MATKEILIWVAIGIASQVIASVLIHHLTKK